jgi:hypothetical protein
VVDHRRSAIVKTDEALDLGVEAYVYLYPLVTMELTRRQMCNAPVGARPGFGPMGTLNHIRAFPAADFKAVVRPNFDTLYSSAWLDLRTEPMVVSAPDTDGRYYLLPMLDMWTDVFAAPGARTSGTGAGDFAVVPPGWSGELPAGVDRIESPTAYAWMIGRTQCNGPADYAACGAVLDGYRVTPLSRWGSASAVQPDATEVVVDPSVDMTTPPLEQVHALSARDYLTLGAELMGQHAPHLTDWSLLARIRRVGLVPGRPFDHDALDADVRAGLDEAPARAQQLLLSTFPRIGRVANGWAMNTDSVGVYGDYYLKRAIITMVGLGANLPEDAIYPVALTDADGRQLDGANDYVLHFDADQLPPVGAFWSVTMYDADGFQAGNELDRFAIGDRDSLRYGPDGSLDLYLQHDDPGPDRVANWLPAPRGALGVTMRLYAPHSQALDGRWNPPAIRRV